MRTKAIEKLTEKTGDADMAAAVWEMFVKHAFAGREPSEAMFKMLDKDESLAAMPVGFRKPLAALWPEAPESPKGRKFKAGRSYTAAEYAGFYEQFPENVSLCEDIERATDGKPWVVFTTKFHSAQSAKYIGWHMAEDIAPATIDVDGVPVAPVMPGEERRKEAKEYPVDPHTPGGFLDVEGKSPRTHADFTGYSEEEIQATIMAYPKLARMDDLSLQNLTLANRGKGAAAILKPFPEIAAAWAAMKAKDRPCAKAPRRPFVEPPASTTAQRGGDVTRPNGWIPMLHVHGVDCNDADWRKLETQLAVAVRAGQVRITTRNSIISGSVQEQLNEMWHKADGMIVLVSAETFSVANRAAYDAAVHAFNGPIAPVLLRACLWRAVDGLKHLAPIPNTGKPIAVTGEWTEAAEDILAFAGGLRPRTHVRPTWGPDMLRAVHAAMISARLGRRSLLAGLPANLVFGLPGASNTSEQLLLDLNTLPKSLPDGSNPLREYIANAAQLSRGQHQETVFRNAMSALDA